MVQNYYKFEPSGSIHHTPHLDGTIGMIASPFVNQIYYQQQQPSTTTISHQSSSNIVTVAGLEHILQWNMKTNQLHSVIHVNIDNQNQYQWIDDTKYGHITCMTMNEQQNMIAIGYQTGRIIVYRLYPNKNNNNNNNINQSSWSSNKNKNHNNNNNSNNKNRNSKPSINNNNTSHVTILINSMGHNSSVTSLAFDSSDSLLASGGDDSDIVMWDIVGCRSLYRLRGHKSRITSLLFFQHTVSPVLVSSSKDMLIKLWELDTQHCVQTLIGSRSEIYGLLKTLNEHYLIAGSTGNELRVWDMRPLLKKQQQQLPNKSNRTSTEAEATATTATTEDGEEDKPLYQLDPIYMGTLFKQSQERIIGMNMDASGQMMAVISDDKMIELFRLRPETELNNRLKLKKRDKMRRLKKKQQQQQQQEEEKNGEDDEQADDAAEDEQEDETTMMDSDVNDDDESLVISEEEVNRIKAQLLFAPFYSFTIDANVKSIGFHPMYPFVQNENGQWTTTATTATTASQQQQPAEVRCIVSTLRNCIMEYSIVPTTTTTTTNSDNKSGVEHKLLNRLDRHGHDTPIRSLSLSKNANMMLSTSGKHARVWNISDRNNSNNSSSQVNNSSSSTQCIRVLDSQYGLSSLFVPGDKHVIIGTKKGQLELFDISSGQMIQHVTDAHSGAVWSMVLKPDSRGIITASSDMTVKFWDFELDSKTKQLSLSLEHTLKMNEDVISIAVSPRGKYLAISLLDNTVKIFYLDTLKFFLSLYGHKLPVNSIAISSDEQLIATASADKNVKIWGLDFGDCHKSLFAHEASITQIAFVRDTHYFFTCSKDGAIKYWDADTYQLIQVLRSVRLDSPLWSMALCSVTPPQRRSHHSGGGGGGGGGGALDQYFERHNNNRSNNRYGGGNGYGGGYEEEEEEEEVHDQVKLIVAGHDRVILSYEQNTSSDALLFIEEEEEKRQEEEYERDLVNSQQFVNLADPNNESTHAGKRTIETIRDGEKLMDNLRVAMEHEQAMAEKGASLNNDSNTPMEVNPLLLGLSVNDYVWRCLTKIAHSELDMVMAILPYNYALYVLQKLSTLFSQHSETSHVEYASRVALILIHIHQKTILLDHKIFPLIHTLSQGMRLVLMREKEVMGLNIAALGFVKNHIRNELEFREFNDQVVSHVHSVQQTQRVLSYREKQREQAKYKKDQEEKEASKSKKTKPKKGRFQGMLDSFLPREGENDTAERETLTFEVKESSWKESQKKRKREAEEERRKKLKVALEKNNESAASDESDAEDEMREVLSGL